MVGGWPPLREMIVPDQEEDLLSTEEQVCMQQCQRPRYKLASPTQLDLVLLLFFFFFLYSPGIVSRIGEIFRGSEDEEDSILASDKGREDFGNLQRHGLETCTGGRGGLT